ncbi:hypothetical protein J4E90_009890 [Alternaria incomplexa]|uniref:uncharacterized protein n=1 Tax=Alternaria incomplexa TaxID=1187928 RepID=UPI0022205892|nr:uncharacterized protein J4E90_009890 [Alternaria incomplexa]KAI4906996.1 hypothetical protein J4E90_009890 [Alternaria incomplexa]
MAVQQEEQRYADGFAEYGNFYGGPSFEYLAPHPSISPTITGKADENVTYLNHTHRVPQQRQETASPPLASSITGSGASIAMQPLTADGISLESGNVFSPMREGPLLSHNPQMEPFSEPPTDGSSRPPGSEGSQAVRPQFPQRASKSSPPQPLRFLRHASTVPSTPPMSWGSSDITEDGLSDRIQSMYIAFDHPSPSTSTPQPLKVVHGISERVSTGYMANGNRSSSMGSSVLPDIPGGLDQSSRRNISISTTQSIQSEASDMSLSDARAEILRRLSRKEPPSDRKGASPFKKSFLLKRAATTPNPASSPSQNDLTDILEEAAAEGSISLVRAVISMGADPIYRSTGKLKKVKHEALAKATMNGRARVVDYLLREGATYGEATNREDYTPMDRALLAAAYKGHADLIDCLVHHGANPMVEQWPREMYDAQHYWNEVQVRVTKTSFLDGLSKWKNVDRGMSTLKLVMQHQNFDPTAFVAGAFDNKSETKNAGVTNRPWQTTYEYSVLSCFIRAGWADAVEEMLSMKGMPRDYEKEDDVLLHQEKLTRLVSPINALTKETWEKRPEDALRILRLLIDRGFNLCLTQRSATDLGPRTALSRAISADAAQAVELILQTKGSLVRDELSFRRNKKETKALPLATALALDSLETARVLLRAGAHPRDPAFENMNVLQFAAYQNSPTNTTMLEEMIGLAPELTYDALSYAIKGSNKDAVRVLLNAISAAALREQIAALPPIYDMLLHCTPPTKPEVQTQYLELIDMVIQWDVGYALQRPRLSAILSAIRKDNYIGMEKLLQNGVVDGRSLVLNSKAQPCGELGTWTMLECCELTDRSSEWLGLLRSYGAPLYH